MRIRVKSDDRSLLKLAADLLILVGAASVLVFAWAMLDGAYYQYSQKLQFETEVTDGSLGVAKQISLPEARLQFETAFQFLPHLPKAERDPLLIGKLESPRIGLSVMLREGVDDVDVYKRQLETLKEHHLLKSSLFGRISEMRGSWSSRRCRQFTLV